MPKRKTNAMKSFPLLIIVACVTSHQIQGDQNSWDETKEKPDQLSQSVNAQNSWEETKEKPDQVNQLVNFWDETKDKLDQLSQLDNTQNSWDETKEKPDQLSQLATTQNSWDETKAKLDQLIQLVNTSSVKAQASINFDQYMYNNSCLNQNDEAEKRANLLMFSTITKLDDYIAKAADLQVDIEDCLGEKETQLRTLSNSTNLEMTSCRLNLKVSMDFTFNNLSVDVSDTNVEVATITPLLDNCSVNDQECIANVDNLINEALRTIPKKIKEANAMADYIVSDYLNSQESTCTNLKIIGMLNLSSVLFDTISDCIENKIHE